MKIRKLSVLLKGISEKKGDTGKESEEANMYFLTVDVPTCCGVSLVLASQFWPDPHWYSSVKVCRTVFALSNENK